jgi:hypothetical protein
MKAKVLARQGKFYASKQALVARYQAAYRRAYIRHLKKKKGENVTQEQIENYLHDHRDKIETLAQTAVDQKLINLKMVSDEEIHLGGTKPMSQYIAADGSKWLAKQAVNCMGFQKVEGALLTAVGANVQRLVDKDTAVDAFVGQTQKHGIVSFQRRLRNVEGGEHKLDLFKFSKHPELATKETLRDVEALMPQILREHVTDWLLCNFDTKGENFVITRESDGPRVLHGIDKEAAFNKIKSPEAQQMSTTYRPHANNTLYNVVFEKFANAEMNFDLRDVYPYAQKISRMSNDDYMKNFQPYLDHLAKSKKPAEVDSIRQGILAQKTSLLSEYSRFFTELVQRRCANVHPDEAQQLRQQYFQADGTFQFTSTSSPSPS